MISLSIYGYKKYKKHQEKKKLRDGNDVPPVVDQSAEFVQSVVSPQHELTTKGALPYTKSGGSGYSGTAAEPFSTVAPKPASESQSYQQYVERQSSSYLNGPAEQPPTYQAALSPHPQQPQGQWIFVPVGGPVSFAHGSPVIPLPPSPLPGSPLSPNSVHAVSPLANELPGGSIPALYSKSTASELPAHTPVGFAGNTATANQGGTSRFELPVAEIVSPSRASQRADSDTESRKSGDMKRYELA